MACCRAPKRPPPAARPTDESSRNMRVFKDDPPPRAPATTNSPIKATNSPTTKVDTNGALKAPGVLPPEEEVERVPTRTFSLQFKKETLCDICEILTAALTEQPSLQEYVAQLGMLEVENHDLLFSLLAIGHTVTSPKAHQSYSSEPELEALLFEETLRAPARTTLDTRNHVSTDAVGHKLRQECTIALMRWYHSSPVVAKRTGLVPIIHIDPSIQEVPEAKRPAVAAKLLAEMDDSIVVELGLAVKLGLRAAIKKVVRSLLDFRKEDEIRRDQELRRTSWWEELSLKRRTSKLALPEDGKFAAFHAWRRKSISANHHLVPAAPLQEGSEKKRYTVVLDLDETLIYTRGKDAHLCARPGIPQFLKRLRELGCEIVVWTASTKDYSAAILSNIDPELQYVSECVYRHPKWFTATEKCAHPRKDLALLGRDLDYTLIIDNSVDCVVGYTETNAILVPDFRGLELDDTLPCLCEFMEDLVESQIPVGDYLEHYGHYHFRLEKKRPNALAGDAVQCFVVDARPSLDITSFSLPLSKDPSLVVTPSSEGA
eukprot:Sspe_Gene.7111::Locus_2402_Transcript_2_2_Confidence_0.667_Length_1934::g.7111::m.7111/K17616/CTDSPL2; CTD small phosphatase-like protein 2